MTGTLFAPHAFTADDPPTVSDFATALGVLDYVRHVRHLVHPPVDPRAPGGLGTAAAQVLELAPYLAADDPDDDAEDHDEAEEVPA